MLWVSTLNCVLYSRLELAAPNGVQAIKMRVLGGEIPRTPRPVFKVQCGTRNRQK